MGACLRAALRHPARARGGASRRGARRVFDIDWQGAQQLFQIAGGDVVRVFVLPPSMEELHDG